MDEVLRQFARFRRRHQRVRAFDLFLEAGFALAVTAAAMLLVDRLAFELGWAAPRLSTRPWIAASLGGALALAAAFAAAALALRPVSPAAVAARVDRVSGGEERFLSALEFAAAGGAGRFADALGRDAVRVAESVDPARAIPRAPVGYRWGLLLALGVGVLLWVFPPLLYAEPAADLDAFPARGPAPLEVFFRDGSIGAIDEFLWEFGDGALGSGERISHVYEKPGKYTATLALVGPGGTSRKTVAIDVLEPGRAAADFDASPVKGRAPLEVTFRDKSRNAKRRTWDFGDGKRSTDEHPVHVYEAPGLYTVKLRIENDLGFDEKIRGNLIKVAHPDEPIADFRAIPKEGPAPLEVAFEQLASGEVSEWAWDLGDLRAGQARLSRERNPAYVYTVPGWYTVRLHVKGPHGDDVEEKPRYIHVTDGGGGGGGGGKDKPPKPKPPPPGGAGRAPKPKEEKGDLQKITPVPETLHHPKPGSDLVPKDLTVYSNKSPGGESQPSPVPLKDVLPQYKRAAEDSIDRELIPPAWREHVRRYYGGAPPP